MSFANELLLEDFSDETLYNTIDNIHNEREQLAAMSQKAEMICDGRGAARIAKEIEACLK